MWQRFTESARKVIFYAQEEAQKFGEGYVSTEHIFLGLLREDHTTAAQVLAQMNVDPKRIREEVEKQLPQGDVRPSHDMTLTPRAKRVMDLAYDEARQLQNDFIGSEHLLLGLCREGDGLAGRVIARFGISLDRLRVATFEVQSSKSYPDSAPRLAPRTDPLPNIWCKCNPEAQTTILDSIKLAMETDGTVYSEHLFLALLNQKDCKATQVIGQFGLTPDEWISSVKSGLPRSTAISGIQIVFTSDTRRVMETAYREAKRLNSDQIGTEHILLALTQSDRIAGRVLSNIASNIVDKMNEEADSN